MSEDRDGLSRRQALKIVGATAAAVALPRSARSDGAPVAAQASTEPVRTSSGRTKRVIVAGGGIAGLSCAYELMKRGHEVTVLEAAGHTGGHVRTFRDPFADGLYVDGGAEHFTKPGYEILHGYVKELGLTALPYPRRQHILRHVDGELRTEEQLADPKVLASLGFKQREIDFLGREPWWKLPALFYAPYLDAFHDEYQPFGVGLDHLDSMTLDQLLTKDGASAAALRHFGNGHGSALHVLWHAAILKMRGVPLFPTEVYRIKGGNQNLTHALTERLGDRVRLGCPVSGIERGDAGVRVSFREHGRERTLEGDWLVSAMSLWALAPIPVKPAWPEARRRVLEGFPYYTASRPVFQSRTRFWERDGVSPNVELGDPALEHYWRMADDVPTTRGLLASTARGATTADAALAAFRRHYRGRSEDIEQVFVVDWASDPWAVACEPETYGAGQLSRFWPRTIEPEGRVQFAGAYADNLNWGMEAATRSANRVALAIDRA
jgi:monoamine oxidase